MSEPITCDVLIVGAGPTGVTLGLLLAKGGMDVIVLDKESDIYPLPRAAHIDHEIVRIFQDLGIADDVMATTRSSSRYDFLTANGEVLLRFDNHDSIGPGGWPVANMIHQPSIEALLREAGAEQTGFTLKTDWDWLSCEHADQHQTSNIQTPDGESQIRARYIVGCDGARSRVREAANIELDDLQFDEPWLVIDALVVDAERLPKINLQICDPNRPTTCVLMGSGRHRWEFMLKPGETPDQVTNDAFVESLLEPWDVKGAITIERTAVYRFNAKIAKTWRTGSLFLAGDAAHQTPPFAGQGMCSGLRDAANLAWKMVAVHQGADEQILDTYQTEREPATRGVIDMAMMMGRTVCITDPEAVRARDKHMIAARSSGSGPDTSLASPPLADGCILSSSSAAGVYFPQLTTAGHVPDKLDDALGRGAWLISKTEVNAEDTEPNVACVSIEDDALKPFQNELLNWLAKHDAEAVLIRPDRSVFGAGSPGALLSKWKTWTA